MVQCATADIGCGTAFASNTDIWVFVNPQPFECPAGTAVPGNAGRATFLMLLFKTLPECLIWGAGTACGEIPPYWLSYAASVAGEVDEDFQEIEELMAEEKGHVCICGGTAMGREVVSLLTGLFVSHGKQSEVEAASSIKKMASEGRLVQELWS